VCRYGGEEFAVVLVSTPAAEAVEFMDQVRTALAAAVATRTAPAFTASFSVALSSDHPELEELVAVSDAVLFEAKDAGRDCIRVDRPREAPVAVVAPSSPSRAADVAVTWRHPHVGAPGLGWDVTSRTGIAGSARDSPSRSLIAPPGYEDPRWASAG
jgi:hypothetical protein